MATAGGDAVTGRPLGRDRPRPGRGGESPTHGGRTKLGLAQLLITHNLGVVAEACQRVAVMYAGEIVETTSVEELFASPRHPYTRRLLAARPRVGAPLAGDPIPGSVPDPIARPPDCAFQPRCQRAQPSCVERHPTLDALAPGWAVRCHYPEPPASGKAVPS